MAELKLNGPLNLMNQLTLQGASGGKVTIQGVEILVVATSPSDSAKGTASPVMLPPPPTGPADAGMDVYVVNSFNQTVKVGSKAAVAQGMVMQGDLPTWPGVVLPSTGNSSPVTANGVPMNVVGDNALIFPSGATAIFQKSGQS